MFQTYLVTPLYNLFVFLIDFTSGDVGLAIIILTLFIRVVFYPAFSASIRTQMGMQLIQGEIDDINKTYKDKPDERARRTMELFKEKKIRPFASFVALLVQIPIFFALYIAFFREGLPHIDSSLLYSFVQTPTQVSTTFLGFINLLTAHNILLAIVVAGTQYLAVRLSLLRTPTSANVSVEKQTAQKMQRGFMLYSLPALLGIISYSFPAAVGIYFVAGNIVSVVQEKIIGRQLQKK